ncbi:MAG: hypothetical protein F6K00_24260 [Leptolyngbya sp. SIOISBB]|nr:hypothetical protein [Leptolyngbya sp. SIOISBB]
MAKTSRYHFFVFMTEFSAELMDQLEFALGPTNFGDADFWDESFGVGYSHPDLQKSVPHSCQQRPNFLRL